MQYSQNTARLLRDSFFAPYAWSMEADRFVHANGTALRVLRLPGDTTQFAVHLFDVEAIWTHHDDGPQVVERSSLCSIGTLKSTVLDLASFQDMLHAQWGVKSWRLRRALMQVMADDFALDGWSWSLHGETESFFSPKTQTPPFVRLLPFLQLYPLCVVQTQGTFQPLERLTFKRLSSAHHVLDLQEEIALVRSHYAQHP